jgi:isoquinoline 1-oxidoreductase subunit beta
MKHDFYRPAALSRFEAGFDAKGELVAWKNVSAGQNIVPQYMARNAGLPMGGPDKTSSEGAFDQAYEFANARVSHAAIDLATPIGFWRGVGHSHQAFFKESFIDECAFAAKADPYQYRLNLLKNHPRHKAVLELAANKANWNTPLAASADGVKKARGIALHESFGSLIVQVAEVSVNKEGAIRVHRVVCAVDCGLAVNPNLIAQQMESAVVFGLSAALYGRIDIEKGVVQQSNFHDYPILRMNEAPIVETYIVPSSLPPEGIGEPGLPPLAPAVANAIFALTGKRLRNLPLVLS